MSTVIGASTQYVQSTTSANPLASFSDEKQKQGSSPPVVNTTSVGLSAAADTIIDPMQAVGKNSNKVQYYVKFSFVVTYILLLTTATITFIEAMRTKYPHVRHILNLETCISVIAGYFYSVFVGQIDKYNEKGVAINWGDITQTRYIDWSITTPLMLLTLCLVLGTQTGVPVRFKTYMVIVGLNYLMLYFGYLGETKVVERWVADIAGFVAFFAMFGIIYVTYVLPKYFFSNYILYGIYLFVWSLYGLVYLFQEEYKNIAMNILDFIAKCFVGLGLWAYFTKIIQ
jgi:bacteriorhodopsin